MNRPSAWFVDPTDGETVRPIGPGRIDIPLTVTDGGRQELWIEGSFGRNMEVRVNGRPVGELGGSINGRITAELVATLDLDAGRHVVTLTQGGGNLAPGNGGTNRLLGPVALVPVDKDAARVKRLPAARWRELCREGRQIDWVEAVRPAT